MPLLGGDEDMEGLDAALSFVDDYITSPGPDFAPDGSSGHEAMLLDDDLDELLNSTLSPAASSSSGGFQAELVKEELPVVLSSSIASFAAHTPAPNARQEKLKPKRRVRLNPNRARDNRKNELAYLRNKVKQMETELGELRQRVGKTPLVTQGSSPPGPKESTLAIAQSTSPSDTTGIPPFWRNMSSQQKLRREKSERENARLKLVLEGQIKLAKSMEKVLQKRARQQLSECAGHVGQNGAQGRTQDFLSDKSTFDTLLSSVDAAYHEVEEVFAANGLTDSETPCRDARMREGTNGMYLDISSNNALPFSKETVGRVVWNHFKGTEKHRGNLYEKATKKVGTTKDTVMEDFKMEFMGKATRADFRVKQVLRRYVEADRELVLWVTNVRSMDEGENRPFAGLGFLEKGYVVIKRPKSSALLKGGFTVLQMCTLVVPQKGETCTQDATAVGAFTEFVLNVFVANTMASEERIENVLLDQALRNPPPVILETRQP